MKHTFRMPNPAPGSVYSVSEGQRVQLTGGCHLVAALLGLNDPRQLLLFAGIRTGVMHWLDVNSRVITPDGILSMTEARLETGLQPGQHHPENLTLSSLRRLVQSPRQNLVLFVPND